MLDLQLLVLDDEVSGSLRDALVLRGSIGPVSVIVLFSSEILEHWPREIQAARLNEMRTFIVAATQRAIAGGRYSDVGDLIPSNGKRSIVVVLGWMDIAS